MKKYLKTILKLICMVLVFTCFTACGNQANNGNTPTRHPDLKPSPKTWTLNKKQTGTPDSDKEQLEAEEQEIDSQQLKEYYDFVSETFRYILAGTENNNITYAPISFYVSLSILSEMTEKEAGKELQDALGYADLDKHAIGLQNMVNSLQKRKPYDKEGIFGRLNLDNSFWLQDTLHYQEDIINTIQKKYNLEVFEGDFQNSEFQKQMTNWVYEKTNHSLQPQFQDLMPPTEDNAFCIINTLDFLGEWRSHFQTEDTKKGIFYCKDGTQVKCKFMNNEWPYATYVAGDGYISANLGFITGEDMIFILPDKTQDIHGFWTKDRLTDILSAWGKDDLSTAKMKFSVPKFNCSSKIDLTAIAKKMHVNQLFNPLSDAFGSFSDDPLYLTGIKQEANISINEIGCSAAAYSGIVVMGSNTAQPEEIEICLNRPFYYILCKNEIPFLIGIIDNPVR